MDIIKEIFGYIIKFIRLRTVTNLMPLHYLLYKRLVGKLYKKLIKFFKIMLL
jgi:hypothetical protein